MANVLPVCCVCGSELAERGLFFHAHDDWMHWRIYVCHECLERIPQQRSLHEQCWECAEPPIEQTPEMISTDQINPRFSDLASAIDSFEKCHCDLFSSLPFSNDGRDCHPGSTNQMLYEWKKRMQQRNQK